MTNPDSFPILNGSLAVPDQSHQPLRLVLQQKYAIFYYADVVKNQVKYQPCQKKLFDILGEMAGK